MTTPPDARRRIRRIVTRLAVPRWPWEAMTKEQHDELVAQLGRPVTQEPIQKRHGGARPDESQ